MNKADVEEILWMLTLAKTAKRIPFGLFSGLHSWLHMHSYCIKQQNRKFCAEPPHWCELSCTDLLLSSWSSLMTFWIYWLPVSLCDPLLSFVFLPASCFLLTYAQLNIELLFAACSCPFVITCAVMQMALTCSSLKRIKSRASYK